MYRRFFRELIRPWKKISPEARQRLPYWGLIAVSGLAVLLFMERIYLTHVVTRQEKAYAENRQLAAGAGAYETAWKQMARGIYLAGRTDPLLADLLKREGIMVRPVMHSAPGPQPATPAQQMGAPAPPISPSMSPGAIQP